MPRNYRDFSNLYDRVPAEEGEETVPATAFGAYGNDEAGHDDADFGNVGLSGHQSKGEGDTFDTYSYGDFDDVMDSESEPLARKSMDSGEQFSNRLRKRQGTTGYDKAPFAHDEEAFALTALEQTKKNLSAEVNQFKQKNRRTIETAQANAMRTGKPIPSVIDMIPRSERAKMAQRAAAKGSAYSMATQVQPRAGIPIASISAMVTKISAEADSDHGVLHPVQNEGKVVVKAGDQITQTALATKAPKKLDLTPFQVQTKKGIVAVSKEKTLHPMLLLQAKASGMGFDFDLSKLWSEVQTSATTAIQNGLNQLQTSASQTLANTATNFASTLVQQPATQAAVQQAAQQVAVQTAVEKIMDPAMQAKIKKYAIYGGAAVGGLALLMIARGMMTRRA